MKAEVLRLEINGEFFIVHIDPVREKEYQGEVYFAYFWTKLNSGENGVSYASESEGGEMHETLTTDCKKAFSFSFCWRGVWEGRVYFPNDKEFWSEELKSMSDLWLVLEKDLEDKIKKENPDYKNFD